MPNHRDALELVLSGGRVARYHTLPTTHGETVGHHSYVVAWLVALLSYDMPSSRLLLAALQHDISEFITGDLPAPTKRSLGISNQFREYETDVLLKYGHEDWEASLTEDETRLLKLADRMAGMVHCLHERKLGNRHVNEAYFNFRSYALELKPRSMLEGDLLTYLEEQWNACQ